MSNADIIKKCTITDYTGTKEDYVEIKAVEQLSPSLAKQLRAEREEYRNENPFAGTIFE